MAASAATIFVSYRRADSASETGRIYDRLVERYGRAQVFKDVDSIPPGVNFPDYIAESIQASDVTLVVIGPRWLDASAGWGRRRLDEPADFVRVEIETALRLGVPVIPVLVGGASMPPARRLPQSLRPLLEQNGLVVRQDPDFTRDMERVYHAVDYWQAQPRRAPESPPTSDVAPAPVSPPPTAEREPTAQPTPAPVETPALATALAERLDDDARQGHARRPPRALILTLVSALLVVAVGVGALQSGALSAFMAPSTPTASPATRTAGAYRAMLTATASERAILGRQVYAPASFGPCDTTSAHTYDRETNPYYWQASSAKLVTCASGHTTTLLGGSNAAQLTFYGLPYYDTGWPTNYTVTMDVGFPATGLTNSQYYCMALIVDVEYLSNPAPVSAATRPLALNMCRDGSWHISSETSQEAVHYDSFGGTLHFNFSVHGSDYSVSVNNRTLVNTTHLDNGYVNGVAVSNMSGGASDVIVISNFVLTPL